MQLCRQETGGKLPRVKRRDVKGDRACRAASIQRTHDTNSASLAKMISHYNSHSAGSITGICPHDPPPRNTCSGHDPNI